MIKKLMLAIAGAGSLMLAGCAQQAAEAPKADIVDTAVAADDFNTLVAAVQAAGLVDTLKGDGPYTVFAPTDEAFAKLPPGTLEALLADKEKLAQVLKYHVVPGRLDAKQVTGMSQLATVQGSTLPVSDIKIGGQGCSISQSSASMMSQAVMGKSVGEVNGLLRRFKSMMSIEGVDEQPGDAEIALGDLEGLVPGRDVPHDAVAAELRGRMRVGLQAREQVLLLVVASPDLRVGEEEPLVARQAVQDRR